MPRAGRSASMPRTAHFWRRSISSRSSKVLTESRSGNSSTNFEVRKTFLDARGASNPALTVRTWSSADASMQMFFLQLLNGLQLSMLIFLLAAGLTLIFGLMDILNLAHGAFFTMGGYAGWFVSKSTGSFWAALVVGPLVPFLIGALLQGMVLQPLVRRGRSTHLDLALLTFGLLFATAGTVEYFFGSSFYSIPAPAILSGHVAVLGTDYPLYRLFVIGAGLAVALVLSLVIDRTLIGAILRAGVDNREMG